MIRKHKAAAQEPRKNSVVVAASRPGSGERLKILRDRYEDELIMGAGQTPQSHALKAGE
jgi:hypothetical protein